jgi:hypothetical protein
MRYYDASHQNEEERTMDMKQLTRKVKVESTKLRRRLEAAPGQVRKQLDAEVKSLSTVPARLRRQLDVEVKGLQAVPTKLKKQLDAEMKGLKKQLNAEVKGLKGVPAKLKKQLDAEMKKLMPANLKRKLEQLPGRAVEAVGIVRESQLKAVKAELSKLSKRVDALSGQVVTSAPKPSAPGKQDAA